MAGKLSGGAIQSGTITTTQISSALNTTISAGGGPKISTIIYPGDDTAANTNGGQTLYITGSGFKSNSTVYINGNNVPSVSFISASNLSFTGPVLSAATYPVYVINPEDGATAILIPGLQVSGEPTWVTGATLAEQDAAGTWNISLSATGDETITYALAAGSSLPGGITLASNGVISGTITTPPENDTTYNFTVDAIDAQNQSSSRAFSVTATTGEGVLFANNVLLIHADGTNNGNNHSFLDSSNNNFTITRFGNASQGSYSPFSQTGWSGYFDGSGDYLKYAENNSAITNWYSQSTTIEAWVYPTSSVTYTNDYPSIVTNAATSGTTNYWAFGINGTKLRFAYFSGSGQSVQSTGNVSLNAWTHIAFVYNSSDNSIKLYINGILDGSSTKSGSPQSDAALGLLTGGWGGGSFAGYISNLRIVTGSAVYTNNFTPSIAPLATTSSNTSLLALQSNRLIDNGPNNFALTRNGDVSVQAFSPFAPGQLSSNSHSVYFDGSGDYIRTSGNVLSGAGDATIECWVYPETSSVVGMFDGGPNQANILRNYPGNTIAKQGQDGTGAVFSLTPNTWSHFAATFSGGTIKVYVNGVNSANGTYSVDYAVGTNFDIGGINGTGDGAFKGYISNFRVTKSIVYSNNFTPSTSPLTNFANTTLLTCQSTTFIDNSTNGFTITPNGNAVPRKINPFGQTYTSAAYSTTNVGGSVYLDGSGDYLSAPDNAIYDFGTGDFTLESWLYPTSAGSVRILIGQYSGSDGFSLELTTGNALTLWLEGATKVTSSGSVTANAWNHVAACRSGSTLRLFINGVIDGSVTDTTNVSGATSAVYISSSAASPGAGVFTGYMSGTRIVKGTAVYTGAFTPPTAPPTNIANTALLLNYTNAGIFDQTAKNVLETVGDAKISTAQYKYGTGSIAFDGSGDRLTIPYTNSFLDLGINGEKFTVEAWIYPTNAMASAGQILSKGGGVASWSTTNGAQYQWGISSSAAYWSWNSSGSALQITNGNVTLNTWQHLAVTYDGTTTRTFLNGVLQATSTSPYTAPTTRNLQYIGMTQSGGFTQEYFGYIDDLRITKGYARYTSNFTAPTAKFKDK